jgi:hypothetical protein
VVIDFPSQFLNVIEKTPTIQAGMRAKNSAVFAKDVLAAEFVPVDTHGGVPARDRS